MTMKHLSKVHKADWALVPAQADPDFDPEHNRRVIEETIRLNDIKREKMSREFTEQTKERNEAATMYLKNLDQGGGESDISKYFGKKELARLRGEQIISKLRENITFRDSKGRITKRAGEI